MVLFGVSHHVIDRTIQIVDAIEWFGLKKNSPDLILPQVVDAEVPRPSVSRLSLIHI